MGEKNPEKSSQTPESPQSELEEISKTDFMMYCEMLITEAMGIATQSQLKAIRIQDMMTFAIRSECHGARVRYYIDKNGNPGVMPEPKDNAGFKLPHNDEEI